jgi:N-acetylglucosamine-6-sulfatase
MKELLASLCVSFFAFLILIQGTIFSKNNPAASAIPENDRVKNPPNILFILTDDLDYAAIEYMPRLKELITDQGVRFENSLVNVSLCCPSRVTTLRGQYSHNTGILTNGGSNGGFETTYALGLEKNMIATLLRSSGYRTALFGKYLNGYPRTAGTDYIPPGWDSWASSVRGNAYSEYSYTLNENGKLVSYGREPKDYGTDVYVGKTNEFMRESSKDNKPFFVFLSVYAPHGPATPAERHTALLPDVKAPQTASFNEADVSDKPGHIRSRPMINQRQLNRINENYRKRLLSLQAVDDGIAKMVETLREIGQLDNTYIVFASDNGFHQGQHRLITGKQTPYEEDIRVPLIIRGPNVPKGVVRRQLVGNIDLAPTFAAIAKTKPLEFMDGRSLLPLLEKDPPKSWRQAYLVEHWTQKSGNPGQTEEEREPGDLDQENNSPERPARRRNQRQGAAQIPEYQGIRIDGFSYIEYATGEKELYDLKNDPGQLNNLAATADSGWLKKLADRLKDLRGCSAEQCRKIEDQALAP